MLQIYDLKASAQARLDALLDSFTTLHRLAALKKLLDGDGDGGGDDLEDTQRQILQLLLRWHSAGGSISLEATVPITAPPLPPQQVEAPVSALAAPEPEEAAAPAEPEADEAPEEDAPVPIPQVAPPSSPLATSADIQRLISGFGTSPSQTQMVDPTVAASGLLLDRLVERGALVGAPLQMFLEDCCGILQDIQPAPNKMLRKWLEWLTAELRALQDDSGTTELDATFNTLSGFVKTRDPGFVHGLARSHDPRRASWSLDAESYRKKLLRTYAPEEVLTEAQQHSQVSQALNHLRAGIDDAVPAAELRERVRGVLQCGVSGNDTRLVRAAAPVLDALEGSAFSSLRAAIRAELAEPEPEPDAAETAAPASADTLAWTGGRRAYIIGGTPRADRLPRITTSFGFREVVWEELTNSAIERLINQLQAGQVDVVVAIQNLISHTVEYRVKPACKAANAPYLLVGGYGVTAIGAALERYNLQHLEAKIAAETA